MTQLFSHYHYKINYCDTTSIKPFQDYLVLSSFNNSEENVRPLWMVNMASTITETGKQAGMPK